MSEFENVFVTNHPICCHNLSIIRNSKTTAEVFRNAIRRITYLLFYKATEDLELEDVTVRTPITECKCQRLKSDKEIIIAPILRAGLIFSDIANEIMPYATVRHIGMYRDEETLTPIWYYNKIPIEFDNPKNKIILILDPMLATGNSAVDAMRLFANKNVPEKNIRFVSLISAPEGLRKVHALYPNVKIVTASIDDHLTDNGYIFPGLGDAGDRIFNTLGD